MIIFYCNTNFLIYVNEIKEGTGKSLQGVVIYNDSEQPLNGGAIVSLFFPLQLFHRQPPVCRNKFLAIDRFDQ